MGWRKASVGIMNGPNSVMQWVVPAFVALAIGGAHFGYNEVRVSHLETDMANILADTRISLNQFGELESEMIERLARIEERQVFILQGLDNLQGRR